MASSSLLTAFDESGTRFALVTPDGRIKSYDTGAFVVLLRGSISCILPAIRRGP
jgi:hypothetical protein